MTSRDREDRNIQLSLEDALFHVPDDDAAMMINESISLPIYSVQLIRDGEQPLLSRSQISSPTEAAQIFAEFLDGKDREHFVALLLDTKNHVLGIHTVSIGTLDSAIVHPREVFKAAVLASAASIIVGHNHPSGDSTPSTEDNNVTSRLVEAGKLMGIDVLDHIVVGRDGSFRSLKQMGNVY